MNTVTAKLVTILICALIITAVISQLILHFTGGYETETAQTYSSVDTVRFSGVYLRNETVIEGVINGAADFAVPDGGKVAADSVIAYVYSSESDIENLSRIKGLEEERDILTAAQNPGTTAAAQPEFISKLIDDSYISVLRYCAAEDYKSLAAERKNLQTLTGIYQIIVRNEISYDTQIKNLNVEISRLSSLSAKPIETIVSGESGYFASYTDGYEETLKPDIAETLTRAYIEKIVGEQNSTRNTGSPGKIIGDYRWKMVGIINTEDVFKGTGSTVMMRMSGLSEPVPALVESISATDDPGKMIIIISCSEFGSEFVARRSENCELIVNDYTGIRIPRSAIRFNEANEAGVYIIQGQKITFKKIQKLFETDTYIISETVSDPAYVAEFDDVIVRGDIDPEDVV
jgi:hypothetical protein